LLSFASASVGLTSLSAFWAPPSFRSGWYFIAHSCCGSLFGRLCGITPDQAIVCPQDAITPGTNQLKVVVVLPFLSPDQPLAASTVGFLNYQFHKVLLCLFSLSNKSFLTIPSVQAGRPFSTSGWLKGLNKTTGHVTSFYPFQKDTRPVAVAQ